MESKCPVQKRIAVAGGDGRETVLLNRILRCCGRSNYSVADVRSSLPSGTQPAVLLAVKADFAVRPWDYPVCVAEYAASRLPAFSGHPHLVTYSAQQDEADFTARNIRVLEDGSVTFEIVGVGIIGRVRMKGAGGEAVGPAMAAASAAIAAGIPFADVLKALSGIKKQESC